MSPDFITKVCAIGATNHEVKGTAQLLAKSHDASGQFPAFIKASAATADHPAQLKLEVQKPFGGAFAILTINGTEYKIEVPKHPEKSRSGQDSWGGIPLVWATDLFLGKVPCPSSADLAHAKIGRDAAGDLLVALPSEQFIYHFHAGSAGSQEPEWPETLRWTKGELVVDFRFDEIDPHTHSPLKWEATSARGEVKTRWRDRELH